MIRVNDADFFTLVKEEVDYDPTKTKTLHVNLNINDKKNNNNDPEWTIDGRVPWIVEEVSDKVESALGIEQLTSINIEYL